MQLGEYLYAIEHAHIDGESKWYYIVHKFKDSKYSIVERSIKSYDDFGECLVAAEYRCVQLEEIDNARKD